jgi:hypothetical protein
VIPWPTDWVERLVHVHFVDEHGGVIEFGKLGAQLRPLKGRVPFEDAERGLAAYLAAGHGRYGLPRFVETFHEWTSAGEDGNGAGNGDAGDRVERLRAEADRAFERVREHGGNVGGLDDATAEAYFKAGGDKAFRTADDDGAFRARFVDEFVSSRMRWSPRG